MMKYIATLVVGVGILVALCNGSCFRKMADPEINGCSHEGVEYERGSSWKTEDCYKCTCDRNGEMRCCTMIGRPENYDENKCNFVFNKEKCSYELLPNDDPTIVCTGYSMVG